MVVTSSDRRGKPKLAQPGNREWATVIQGVNSQGWTVPPYIIVKGQYHLSSWYGNDALPKDWRIAVSANDWTTNELTADWLKYFDKYTKSRKSGVYLYRLLILDGHESHYSDAFKHHCKKKQVYYILYAYILFLYSLATRYGMFCAIEKSLRHVN